MSFFSFFFLCFLVSTNPHSPHTIKGGCYSLSTTERVLNHIAADGAGNHARCRAEHASARRVGEIRTRPAAEERCAETAVLSAATGLARCRAGVGAVLLLLLAVALLALALVMAILLLMPLAALAVLRLLLVGSTRPGLAVLLLLVLWRRAAAVAALLVLLLVLRRWVGALRRRGGVVLLLLGRGSAAVLLLMRRCAVGRSLVVGRVGWGRILTLLFDGVLLAG